MYNKTKQKLQQLFKMLKLRNISSCMYIEVFEVEFLKLRDWSREGKHLRIFTIFWRIQPEIENRTFGNKKRYYERSSHLEAFMKLSECEFQTQ